VNLSAGGLFFRSNIPFESKASIMIRFTLPDHSEQITTTCTVIHILETIPGRQCFVGVIFEELEGISFAKLNTYLHKEYD